MEQLYYPPKKLWRNMRKRLAKKLLRKRWKKLNFGRTLQPGNLISTCCGYNERIKEIKPNWSGSGKLIIDFDIKTEAGGSHSLIHCCEGYIESREEIEKYWMSHDCKVCKDWYEEWSGGINWEDSIYMKIISQLKEGKEVFDEDGLLIERII